MRWTTVKARRWKVGGMVGGKAINASGGRKDRWKDEGEAVDSVGE